MKIVRKVDDLFRIEDGRTMFVFVIHATSKTNCVEQVWSAKDFIIFICFIVCRSDIVFIFEIVTKEDSDTKTFISIVKVK